MIARLVAATPPTFERVFPAPSALRAAMESAALDARYDRRGEISPELKRWMEDFSACLFRGALWIAEGGFVRRLSLPEGRPDGEWAFPDLRAAFGSEAPGKAPETFEPAFALDGDRLLWLLRGYRADHRYLSVPVVFDPRGHEVWTVLRPSGGDVLGGTGLRAVYAGESAGNFLAVAEVDSGVSDSEFVMMSLWYELDLAKKTYSSVEGPLRMTKPPGLLAIVPVGVLAVPEQLHFMIKGDRLVCNGKPKLGPRGALIEMPLEGGPFPDHSLYTRDAGGAASAEAILVHELLTVPGARRLALWM